MRKLIKVWYHISVGVCTGTLLAVGLGCSPLSSEASQDLTVTEKTFGCILDWPKVRNTRFKHSDPEKLKEAMRILRDSVPDKEYPVGTILQLVPSEAMMKHPHEKFPKTNGWEFFALEVSRYSSYPKLVYYKRHEKGGNFVTWEQPQLLSEDVRAGFRSLR